MKDFFTAALPWIIIGISIAVLAANNKNVRNKEDKEKSYISEGMCLGMSMGILFSPILNVDLGLGISLGLLLGIVIGSNLKK